MNPIATIIKALKSFFGFRESGTVRYMFPVIFGLFAILGANALSSIDESYVKLVPDKTMVMKGESFFIEIYAYAHIPVNALDIEVSFDPNSVEVVSVDKGQSVLTIWTQEPKVEANKITLGGGTYRRGFVGEHLVATIKAVAKNSGKTEFLVRDAQLLAGDGKGTPVKLADKNDGSVQNFIIYNQNEDPAKISASVGVGISADIDGDGTVTLKDISSFMAAWYSGSKTYDFNTDGQMNFIDFSIILARSFFRSSN